nr:helix-turn-helix domain-containing protein [Acidisoma cellulosilyticum]
MNPRSDRIQTALTYARQNLRGVLSVEVLAQAAGLGPRQFSRAFRTETGTSPAKAIETLRIEAAQLMIEQSNHPIEIIAAETGFGDQERMRRAFQRVLGRPPQAIRAQAKAR